MKRSLYDGVFVCIHVVLHCEITVNGQKPSRSKAFYMYWISFYFNFAAIAIAKLYCLFVNAPLASGNLKTVKIASGDRNRFFYVTTPYSYTQISCLPACLTLFWSAKYSGIRGLQNIVWKTFVLSDKWFITPESACSHLNMGISE